VRQGSLIVSSMILMQQPDTHPSVKPFREKIAGIVREKHPSTMTKVGAIMAHGLLDAGGRNVTLSLKSRAGFTRASAIVGVALWAQHWYWYPLQYMIGLAFSPSMCVGLNKNFDMPTSFTVTCAAKPSQFAYPKMTEPKKEEKKERVATVSLSTTARAKAREARKDKLAEKSDEKSEDIKMDEDEGGESKEGKDEGKEEAKQSDEKAAKKKKIPEPTSFTLSNPSRATPEQETLLSFNLEQRYVPVNPRSKPCGIIVLTDQTPDEEQDVVQVELPGSDSEKDEAKPPEPFEWSPDIQN